MDEHPAHGRYLARLRSQRGLSIRQAAARSSTGDSYWGQVERGVKKPSRPMLLEMAAVLDATPTERDQLLDLAGYPAVGFHAARRRLEEAAELLGYTPAQRDRLLEFAGVATTRVAQSGQSGHDATPTDPLAELPTSGKALSSLAPEVLEEVAADLQRLATARRQAPPQDTEGDGVAKVGGRADGSQVGRGRRAAGTHD